MKNALSGAPSLLTATTGVAIAVIFGVIVGAWVAGYPGFTKPRQRVIAAIVVAVAIAAISVAVGVVLYDAAWTDYRRGITP